MATSFTYSVPNVDLGKLQAECLAAGLPVVAVNGGAIGSPDVTIVTSADLTSAQKTTLDSVVAAHDGRPRRRRKLFDILADLTALTAAQKTAVSNDLFGGSPAKWTQDAGPNAVGLLGYYTQTQLATLSAADKNLIRLHAATLYVQDVSQYLVHPAFDPTINVPGDEPYTP